VVQDASEGRKIAATSKMADAGTFGLTCRIAEAIPDAVRWQATGRPRLVSRAMGRTHVRLGWPKCSSAN